MDKFNFVKAGTQFVPTDHSQSGICGYISWGRLLKECFEKSREIGDGEEVIAFTISEKGIEYIIEK